MIRRGWLRIARTIGCWLRHRSERDSRGAWEPTRRQRISGEGVWFWWGLALSKEGQEWRSSDFTSPRRTEEYTPLWMRSGAASALPDSPLARKMPFRSSACGGGRVLRPPGKDVED